MPQTPPLVEHEAAYVEAVRSQELAERLGGRFDREGALSLLGDGADVARVVPLSIGLERDEDEQDDQSVVSSRAVNENARRIGLLEDEVKEMRKEIERLAASMQDILDILTDKERVSKRAPRETEADSRRAAGRGGEITVKLTEAATAVIKEEKGKERQDTAVGFTAEVW